MDWYIAAIKKCTKFKGRSRRKEYWYFVLINLIIVVGLNFLQTFVSLQGISPDFFDVSLLWQTISQSLKLINLLYTLLAITTWFSVSVRRLHDTGRSGWWFLLYFIPLANFVLLFFYTQDSQPERNQYGKNPKEINSSH